MRERKNYHHWKKNFHQGQEQKMPGAKERYYRDLELKRQYQ